MEWTNKVPLMGVTFAQLVKAYVGQADVQRFEPHLGHNWLSCGVSCKHQVLWAPSGTNHNCQIGNYLPTEAMCGVALPTH